MKETNAANAQFWQHKEHDGQHKSSAAYYFPGSQITKANKIKHLATKF